MSEASEKSMATAIAEPRPYVFPMENAALLVLKMQREFLEEGGYGAALGNDVSMLKECVPNVKALLDAARSSGLRVFHVKEGHLPDLSDLPPSKGKRALLKSGNGSTIGREGPYGRLLVDGEPCNDFVEECVPLEGETVIRTPAKGLFYHTNLHSLCVESSITHLLIAGVTTDIGVQLVMRELNDRGYEPCLVSDCTASYSASFKSVSLEMISAQGGIIGWTSTLGAITEALTSPVKQPYQPRPEWVPDTVPLLLAEKPSPMCLPKPLESSTGPVVTVDAALPHPFSFSPASTACVVIDMQRDFIMEGGFGSTLGNNVKLLQAIIPNVSSLLSTCREHGITLVHTLEAHLPDLSDCPLAKLTRGQLPEGLRIGDTGKLEGRILVRNEWGNEIVDENAPLPGEKVIHKPGKGAFCATDLHEFLLSNGITHLLFAGVTTEVCVQTSMREASDRGFECALVTDCTESYFPHFKTNTVEMLTAQGAIVGWALTSDQIKSAIVAQSA